MICYQENTHFSQALPCSKEVFWEMIKRPNTAWRVNARRAILEAVEASKTEGAVPLHNWLESSDFQRYDEKKKAMKRAPAREAWAAKSDAEKLLSYAREIKENLPAFIFCCREFDAKKTAGGKMFRHRKLEDCHLNGLVMLDIDHVENPMQIWYTLRDNKELMQRVALVHITSSAQGIRIIFTVDMKQGNLADNQIEFAKALGCKADGSCIDATRNSFAPKEEDILFINEDLVFNYYDEKFDQSFTPLYRDNQTQPINHKLGPDGVYYAIGDTPSAAVASASAAPSSGTNVPVGDQPVGVVLWRGVDIQKIINARYEDRLPCREDSNRHNESLKLATDLMLMLDSDKKEVLKVLEMQPWVQEIIAERDENVEKTVQSAADCVFQKEHKYASSQPSIPMQKAIEKVVGKTYREITNSKAVMFSQPSSRSQRLNRMLDGWGAEIEAMFDDFPILRDVCKNLKRSQYPAALFVAGGTLMTLMTRTWYRFYHHPEIERRLNCSLFIIGHPASNKSLADDLFRILSTPMEMADKAGLAALNRYKQEQKKKAANKEGKDKPQGIIRIHPARTSNGQLISDMINAKESVNGSEVQLHMVTFDTELDNSTTLQQGGSWINKQSLELKAFHNERDGQMYQNQDSPVDNFTVLWNFIYSGTPIALKRKVNDKNFGSGLSTRLAVIPVPKTNCEMIEKETEVVIDWDRRERLSNWSYKLDRRYGQLPFWDIVDKLYDWTKDNMEEIREEPDENERDALELMLKRVPYHAINYSAPFIDMRHFGNMKEVGGYWVGDYKTDETDWKLAELIARIQFETQQHFFGVLAERYFTDMNSDVQFCGTKHYQKSIEGYERLPEVFNKEDVMTLFDIQNPDSAQKRIRRMEIELLVTKIEEGADKGKYRKVQSAMRQ